MEREIKSYRDLIVWQKSMALVTSIYKLTEQFPQSEIYGLTSQMRRSAVSIPSNIAEGSKRSSRKDFKNFLQIASGSGAELETQVEIAKRMFFGRTLDYQDIDSMLNEVMRMLNSFIKRLSVSN
ncbi:MAG: four helix bundle protein [bacterium]|nr:four helix bundle protein [bacterium]